MVRSNRVTPVTQCCIIIKHQYDNRLCLVVEGEGDEGMNVIGLGVLAHGEGLHAFIVVICRLQLFKCQESDSCLGSPCVGWRITLHTRC